jgi:hypothetical protein
MLDNVLRKYLRHNYQSKDYTSILEDIFKDFNQWGFNISISQHPWPIESILLLPPEAKKFIVEYKKRTSPPDQTHGTVQQPPYTIQSYPENALNEFRAAFPNSQLIDSCTQLVDSLETSLRLLLDKISNECYELNVSRNLELSLNRHFTDLWLAVHNKVLDSTSIAEGLSSEFHSVSERLKVANTSQEIIKIIREVIDRLNLLGYNTTELEKDIQSFERLSGDPSFNKRQPSNLLDLNQHFIRIMSRRR